MTRLERSDRIAKFVLIAAVAAGCASPFALGAWNESDQSNPQASGRLFAGFDSNHDGVISVAEASLIPGLTAVFGHADLDQDGRLSRVEFIAAQGLIPSAGASNAGVGVPVQLALGKL
ncbi:MAG TPA: hypothetical protein VH105_02780 [Burkholderiales bacterium]|nr:hypothetical protein [Burkholderiales bacterium]